MKINNNNKIIYIKNILKNLIIDLNKNNNKLLNNKINISSKYNNELDYIDIIYNKNNNKLLSNLKYRYIIKNYIKNILSNKIFKDIMILYKEPIIYYNNKSNNNKLILDVILFIYKPIIINENNNNNNNILLLEKLINNLINKPLNKIINDENININIKPILLKYNYMDSDIYSKSINKLLSKFNGNLNNNNDRLMDKKNLNKYLLTDKPKYISNINDINKLNNKLLKNNNNKNINLINIINKINIKLNNKFNKIYNNNIILGNNLLFKGKNPNAESNARALRNQIIEGKLNIINKQLNKNPFKLNHYLVNLNKSQSPIINKNGKYNISVTLSNF